MGESIRLKQIEAAHQFVNKHFPNCQGALLAGSVIRGQATATSDLDIVIFDTTISSPYRDSLVDFGWAIEVFVHNLTSYKRYFESDCQRARPSLPNMVMEGVILKDSGIVSPIKKEAKEIIENGPEEWSTETIQTKRYFITDALDDFKGSTTRLEEIFIANRLAELASEFVLRTNRQWIGTSKWTFRALTNYDEQFANQFAEAFDAFYRTEDKKQVIYLVENILQPHGGRLFDGYSVGKN